MGSVLKAVAVMILAPTAICIGVYGCVAAHVAVVQHEIQQPSVQQAQAASHQLQGTLEQLRALERQKVQIMGTLMDWNHRPAGCEPSATAACAGWRVVCDVPMTVQYAYVPHTCLWVRA